MTTLHRMDRENKPWYGQPCFWWLIVILLAGLAYLTGITHESIWFDEAFPTWSPVILPARYLA